MKRTPQEMQQIWYNRRMQKKKASGYGTYLSKANDGAVLHAKNTLAGEKSESKRVMILARLIREIRFNLSCHREMYKG